MGTCKMALPFLVVLSLALALQSSHASPLGLSTSSFRSSVNPGSSPLRGVLRLQGGASKERVAIIGSGNWGSAIATVVGKNVKDRDGFDEEVRMWVFEEMIGDRKLTDIINTQHENVKYLKGIKLPENVVADPDLGSAVTGATMLIFVLPHQFLGKICPQMKGKVARGCKALSLIKGIEFENKSPKLISQMIAKEMGGMDVSVLMGANLANEVAQGQFCESTVGYNIKNHGLAFQKLLNCDSFRVNSVKDVAGVELCGALKNVVALAAGFCDGLGYGGNTKAAIIRIGLTEMKLFAQTFYSASDPTFMESCGVADLITTCYGGRNRKCAEAFAKSLGQKSWDVLEKEMLNGQKLQGTITSQDVMSVLVEKKLESKFPLFTMIHDIAFKGRSVQDLTTF